jgi:hypothetical protein
MSLKQPAIAIVAAALFAVAGSASASAQGNCAAMYNRVMGAYQTQAPYYTQMLAHYNARCLSGSSMMEGHHYRRHDDDRWRRDDDRWGQEDDRSRQGR